MTRSTFTLPAILAAASLVGLFVALTGDGARDVAAWVALAAPLAATAWAIRRRP